MTKPNIVQVGMFAFAIVSATATLFAQSVTHYPDTSGSSTKFLSEAFKFSGEWSAYGEVNEITGAPRRRDPTTGRIFFRPTLTFLDAITVSADLLLSTEGNSARQDINQLGLHPSWVWGRAHIGDYSDEISPYTLSGIPLRGGGVVINPGLFRFSALGGQARRAVAGGSESGSYKRYLMGASIGVGDDYASFVDLQVLRVRDDPASLAEPNSLVSAYG